MSTYEVYQKVKIKNQKLVRMLNPLAILEWKLENVAMDFVVVLPVASNRHDFIWAVVDRLTKTAPMTLLTRLQCSRAKHVTLGTEAS